MNCISEYLEKMKSIQQSILEYVDDEVDSEDKFQNIIDILTKNKIEDNQDDLKTFLYLLTNISNNHRRNGNFFSKIERILEYLKEDLQKFYSNSELFHIFSSNKRILLFLIEAKILIFDEYILKQIIQDKYVKAKYPQYFQPEIQPFINKSWFPKYNKILKSSEWILEIRKEISEDFYKRRKIGENDHLICELIQKDSLEEFVTYMNQNNCQFYNKIDPSIYETNDFLLKERENYKDLTIIEYAAFFGSTQIFNYLKNKGAKLMKSLWEYAIHGNNAEIMQILEDNQIKPEDKSYKTIMKESIKCHHNEIADYIQNNFLVNDKEEEESKYEAIYGIKYYNFKFINNEQINETTFNYLCEYDYCTLVSILLNTANLDINHKTIYKINHFNSILKIEITNDIYIKQS